MLPVRKHLKDVVRVNNPGQSRFGYLRLDKNENVIELPPAFVEKLKEGITSEFLNIYPELDNLYDKIAGWLGCKRENLYLSSGSDGAIKTVFEVFVDPGDTVVLPSPTYAMFYVYSRLFQAALKEVHYPAGLDLSIETIIKEIVDARAKLVCIANPNAPTGMSFNHDELETLIAKAESQGTVVLMDEAYFHYCPVTAMDLIHKYKHLVVTRTFSKAVGLAAGRLGFACGSEEMAQALHKFRPMYETNAFAAKAIELLIDMPEIIENNAAKVREGREFLEKELAKKGIRYFKSSSNFMLIEVGGIEKSREIVKKLREKKILIAGGFNHPSIEKCIRVSLADPENMKSFLDAFIETAGKELGVTPVE